MRYTLSLWDNRAFLEIARLDNATRMKVTKELHGENTFQFSFPMRDPRYKKIKFRSIIRLHDNNIDTPSSTISAFSAANKEITLNDATNFNINDYILVYNAEPTLIGQVTTAALTAGDRQTITVASTTGMVAGNYLSISDDNNQESIKILNVPSSTTLVADLANSYTSGAYVTTPGASYVAKIVTKGDGDNTIRLSRWDFSPTSGGAPEVRKVNFTTFRVNRIEESREQSGVWATIYCNHIGYDLNDFNFFKDGRGDVSYSINAKFANIDEETDIDSLLDDCLLRQVDADNDPLFVGAYIKGDLLRRRYTTGTVEVTINDPTVRGTGTNWSYLSSGASLFIDGDHTEYTVSSSTATTITLTGNVSRASASGLKYILVDKSIQTGTDLIEIDSVRVTYNSNIVTGVGTTWIDDGIITGGIFTVEGDDKEYIVDYVSSNTSLSLTETIERSSAGAGSELDYSIKPDRRAISFSKIPSIREVLFNLSKTWTDDRQDIWFEINEDRSIDIFRKPNPDNIDPTSDLEVRYNYTLVKNLKSIKRTFEKSNVVNRIIPQGATSNWQNAESGVSSDVSAVDVNRAWDIELGTLVATSASGGGQPTFSATTVTDTTGGLTGVSAGQVLRTTTSSAFVVKVVGNTVTVDRWTGGTPSTATEVKAYSYETKYYRFGDPVQIYDNYYPFTIASATQTTATITGGNQYARADDGGVFANDDNESAEDTADDMNLLPATPAVNDAYYFGADNQFRYLQLDITTPGVGVWTLNWEYYNGSACDEILDETDFATHVNWDTTGVADVTGGNVDFTFAGGTLNGTVQQVAADRVSAGQNSISYSFTYTIFVAVVPNGDFALTLDNFSSTSVTLPFTPGSHSVSFTSASDAGTQPFTITATETTSTQGCFTIDNVSCNAWASLDDFTNYNYIANFRPPNAGKRLMAFNIPPDWATTTINGQSAYWIRARVSSYTSITTQPKAGQMWLGFAGLSMGNDLFGGLIQITSGAGKGQVRRIISNTASTITISRRWDILPIGATAIASQNVGNSYIQGFGLRQFNPDDSASTYVVLNSTILDEHAYIGGMLMVKSGTGMGQVFSIQDNRIDGADTVVYINGTFLPLLDSSSVVEIIGAPIAATDYRIEDYTITYTSNTITVDPDPGWRTIGNDQWAGATVRITDGANAGDVNYVISNTTDTLTIRYWDPPASNSSFIIYFKNDLPVSLVAGLQSQTGKFNLTVGDKIILLLKESGSPLTIGKHFSKRSFVTVGTRTYIEVETGEGINFSKKDILFIGAKEFTGSVDFYRRGDQVIGQVGEIDSFNKTGSAITGSTAANTTYTSTTAVDSGAWDLSSVKSGMFAFVDGNILDEPEFTTHVNWDVTNDFDDSGGNIEYTWSANQVSTAQQIFGDRASLGQNSTAYTFTYTLTVIGGVAPDGDFDLTLDNFPSASTTLPFTTGTHEVSFTSAANATAQHFTITATATTASQGNFTINNVSCIADDRVDIEGTIVDVNDTITVDGWYPKQPADADQCKIFNADKINFVDKLDVTPLPGDHVEAYTLTNSQSIRTYGLVERPYENSSIVDPRDLIREAEDFMDSYANLKPTYQINFAHLFEYDPLKYPYDDYVLGDTIRVVDDDLDIDVNLRIIKEEWDPNTPADVNVEVSSSILPISTGTRQHIESLEQRIIDLEVDLREEQRKDGFPKCVYWDAVTKKCVRITPPNIFCNSLASKQDGRRVKSGEAITKAHCFAYTPARADVFDGTDSGMVTTTYIDELDNIDSTEWNTTDMFGVDLDYVVGKLSYAYAVTVVNNAAPTSTADFADVEVRVRLDDYGNVVPYDENTGYGCWVQARLSATAVVASADADIAVHIVAKFL